MTAAVDRTLSGRERELMASLAVHAIADHHRVTVSTARSALKDLADTDGVYLVGDAHHAYLRTGDPDTGPVIVRGSREALVFHAEIESR